MLAPLGAVPDDAGTTFRIWSTTHTRCDVRLYDADGGVLRDEPLVPRGDGVFEAHLAGIGHGARYRYVLDGRALNDPYARALPDGIAGPAAVVQPRHRWVNDHVVRPLREHVIYELHVGTFTAAGTYAAATERLPQLAELGVTAIELMPIAAYGGRRGWGYDGVAHFAPHFAYGEPDALRAMVDAAHGAGLAVFLDVVYNHFGPAGNVLREYSTDYFTTELANPWGEAPNFRQAWMRRYVLDNIRYWLDGFRIDGLRFDAVHAIGDRSDPHIVQACIETARAVLPGVILMAEDDRNDPMLVERLGFDAVWADDFHHAVHVTLTGEQDGYYAGYTPGAAAIAGAIERGWIYEGQVFPTSGAMRGRPADHLPAEAFIYCLQNHDQIGNRARGERLTAVASIDAYHAATMLLLFLPMTPLLHQGAEWAASSPFPYFTDHEEALGVAISEGRRREFARFTAFGADGVPDPQAAATFDAAKLDWSERTKAPHAETLALHAALLRLRRADPVLAHARREGLSATAVGDVLVVHRHHGGARRVLVANLGTAPVASPVDGRVLVTSRAFALPMLPPWSAAIVEPA